jgi:hypothetical protein
VAAAAAAAEYFPALVVVRTPLVVEVALLETLGLADTSTATDTALVAVAVGALMVVLAQGTVHLVVLAARLSQRQHLIRYRITELFTEQHNEYHMVL